MPRAPALNRAMREHFGIDIGNSRVKIFGLPAAAFDSGPEDLIQKAVELEALIWDESEVEPLPRMAEVDMISVRPALSESLKLLLETRGCRVRLWTVADLPIVHPYADPARLGPDRLLAAFAARELLGAPQVIVDAGTALTVDLVDGEGRFAGGAIAPGFRLLARSLAAGGAMLREIGEPNLAYPGRSTDEALSLGVTAAFAGSLDRLVRAARDREAEAGLVVTGGDAELALQLLDEKEARRLPLVVLGLLLLAARSRS